MADSEFKMPDSRNARRELAEAITLGAMNIPGYRAREIPEYGALKDFIKALKKDNEFSGASALLQVARKRRDRGTPEYTWMTQQLALCTYKDENIPPAVRYDQAIPYLEEIGLRETAQREPETLALGGAVYRRRFDHSGQLDDLNLALFYYRAAWERDPMGDLGYGGVNAAFVLDMMAARAQRIAGSGEAPRRGDAGDYRASAKELRREIVDRLTAWRTPDLDRRYFFVVTLAEAHYGLQEFDHAARYLAAAKDLEPDEWELQTTARQLATLARLQGHALPRDDDRPSDWSPAWRTLVSLLGDITAMALGCSRGKIGLALSGGGFRASLFHIGVMARLAEIGVLPSVEVLSTVSGGSILGAHYYLLLRRLLRSKRDIDITRIDYIELVGELQREFFAGVKCDIRMRGFSNFFANLRMFVSRPFLSYRTIRLGTLYEKLLYSRIADDTRGAPRLMRDLMIDPLTSTGNDGFFNPRFSNWRRRAKVPALVINATSLNSGHAWQFNAKSMGEPPALVGQEVDMKPRYRRPYYDQIQSEELKRYRLGSAVGASSCVPLLLAPLALRGLYPERTVRLVDGGVHDNQGVQGLLTESCNFILCSDASGQMADASNPDPKEVPVLFRTNDTLMERVRETEYQHLSGLHDYHALAGFFFAHLKKDLDIPTLDWIGGPAAGRPAPVKPCTAYGVAKDLQARLAKVRTDLDCFSEVEAYALMLSGYLMTEHDFKTDLRELARLNGFEPDAPRGNWTFLQLEPLAGPAPAVADPRRADLALQLDVASQQFFKIWHLSPLARMISPGRAGALAGLTAAAIALWLSWGCAITLPSITLDWLLVQKLAVAAVVLLVGGAAILAAAINVHLCTFDRLFLARGRLKRLLDLK